MWKRKAIGLLFISILVISILSGCGAENDGNSKANAVSSAKEEPLQEFKVGYLPTPGHVLYFVAQEKGYFKEEGLDVNLFQFTNSGEGMNAVAAGKLDAGSFGTAVLTFIARGADLTIFGGQQSEGHGLIATPEKAAELKDLQGYRGKTIATVRLATGDVVFRGALKDVGIDWRNDIIIRELDSPAAVLEAVKKGSVDGGIVWTPFIKMAEKQGLQVVTYSGELLKSHVCCRQVALNGKITENPQAYEKFMAALIRAHEFYLEHREETVDIISMYVKIDKEIIREETYSGYIASQPDPDRAGVKKMWDFMKKTGYIESSLEIDEYINTDIYEKALNNLILQDPQNEVYRRLEADFKQ